MNNTPPYDWTQGPRWTVGERGSKRPAPAAGGGGLRWFVVVVVVAVAATLSVLGFAGVSAKGATLYPCAGAPADAPQTMYPEKRYYLETQAWWTPMPGHTMDEPFQDRTGHVHVSACVPLYQTVSGGTLHLDLKWQEHMMQGVNGQYAPLPLNFNVNIEGVFKGPYLRGPLGLWPGVPCTTMQCEGWVSFDFDYSQAPSGWGNLNPFIQDYFTDCPDTLNCRQLRTLTHWPVNFVTSNPPSTSPSVLTADAYTGGESWFTADTTGNGSNYARAMVARSEIAKLWNSDTGQLVPKSGIFHITIEGEKDGSRALIDPKLHNMPPILGTVVMDDPPATGDWAYKNYDLAIDTTQLTDGVHRLFFQNIFKRSSGEQSGVAVLPFLVANSTPPPPTTTTPTTTTTTPPGPSNTKTTPGHHAKPKLTCAKQRATHLKRVKALRAMVAKLQRRLAHQQVKNDRLRLRRRIARARKEIAAKTRCA